MKRLGRRFPVLCLAVLFTFSFLGIPYATAAIPDVQNVDVEVTVKINEKGFLDKNNKLFGPKNPLIVQKGKVIRITFLFSEKMTSLAYGDTHKIEVIGQNGWEVETKKIWMFDQKDSVTFVAGENGQTRYRGYCVIDCIGMDHLNNLVIKVV